MFRTRFITFRTRSTLFRNWEEKITEHFKARVLGPEKEEVPWLAPDSKSGSLVRQVAMVQDIMDQELYAKEFVARLESGICCV